MADPGRYKSQISSNQMLRDINNSLQHLHFRESRGAGANQQQHDSMNNTSVLQSQCSFEQQLGLAGGMNALSQSAAGERRSYPRAITSNKAALEKISKDLQPFAFRNGFLPVSNGYMPKINTQFQNAKSSSVHDIHQAGIRDSSSSDQRKLSVLVSNGYDEALAIDVIRNNPNKSVEVIADIMNTVNARKNLSKVQPSNRILQNSPQAMYNVTSYAPRAPTNVYNPAAAPRTQYGQSRHSNSSLLKRPPNYEAGLRGQVYASNPNMYESVNQRQYSDRVSVLTSDTHYSQYPPSNNYQDQRPHSAVYPSNSEMMSEHVSIQTETSPNWKNPKQVEQIGRTYEGVTLRQKTTDRKITPQNRWSAEVLHATTPDVIPHKPPPPYPGMKKNLTRIPSQEAEVVGTNNPVTVIFDEKNGRVKVVGGIPDGYESVIASSPSSSGQSSPRSLRKEPPPYYATSSSHQLPNKFSPQSSTTQITSSGLSHGKQFSPQSSSTQISPLQHPVQTHGQQDHIFAVPQPPPSHNPKTETHFMPITDSSRRGSPPPYPGSSSKNSNRSSLNLDELESSVIGAFPSNSSYYSSGSSSSSKKTSTATEPGSFNQSDSSTNTSPTPDGVERSYSPLPNFTNSPYHTMVVHPREKKEEKCDENVEKVEEPFCTRLKNYTPQAYKFYMEQHVENLLKLQDQRRHRRRQLEAEMARVGLPDQAQEEMRKLLNQKESNYIRLKRAKMDRSMFTKVKVVGVGAFGEVTLVRKNGTSAYYAMKILRKSEVLRRNQVAHVKAERDILAEADNEWVVKLYYSFQDQLNLYFVMDYVPGGDLMALLIKLGIFQPYLALFYISELVLAIESVHKLGFIHRDIKPDNVLIDKNGHIKLTDFGLCTGFRWTHDSKYYQPEPEGGGRHTRQFSMEPEGGWESLMNDVNCNCKSQRLKYDLCKPLQRRHLRRHMRCQAHSLVGTPNYIAPEVLMRIPYSQQCDWWSVGVILYEMIIGQPPFLAHSPAETQFKVINWMQTLTVPKHSLAPEAEDLIRRLCTSPEERLGKDGADEIKQHPYFREVDFSTIHQKQAPHIPVIRSPTDTSNFDPVPENMSNGSDSEEPKPQANHKKGAEFAFYEFTFRHFFDDGGLANPNMEIPESEEAKPKKRPANTSQKSMSVPNKVAAPSPSSEDKAPVYV